MSGKQEEKAKYSRLLFPLGALGFLELTEEAKGRMERGPLFALLALKQVVRKLFDFKVPEHWGPFAQQRWNIAVRCLRAGAIKETDDYGKTSVSNGLLVDLKKRLDTTPSLVYCGGLSFPFIVANFGTGGVKFQVLELHPGHRNILRTAFECKGQATAANPAMMEIGSWKPCHPHSQEQQVQRLRDGILELRRELGQRGYTWLEKGALTIHAFITAEPLRSHYAEQTRAQKSEMDDKLEEVFQSACSRQEQFVSWDLISANHSFFMSQKNEGRLETKAARALYDNLIEAGMLADVRVVGSAGMGRGSSQLPFCTPQVGMNCVKDTLVDIEVEARLFGCLFEDALPQTARLMFIDWLKDGRWFTIDHMLTNVLALKSGFAMGVAVLLAEPELKAAFDQAVAEFTLTLPSMYMASSLYDDKDFHAGLSSVTDGAGFTGEVQQQEGPSEAIVHQVHQEVELDAALCSVTNDFGNDDVQDVQVELPVVVHSADQLAAVAALPALQEVPESARKCQEVPALQEVAMVHDWYMEDRLFVNGRWQ